ncbi:ABC transporter ATP-binding protein [Anaerorhabdus furcosa]|uniref:ATP-binding cassette, subfamily B n=1 Tax=Anaerorhabdus furcosa TaxID=118967 RepID=A0A1T4L8Z1_9FIRM|nr:ABC transporter ATP-binding protein [Anaerorhabdus furcosa]SJZ51144.1 ATP-binding cassette, subfamily B [Anaerorhabdus furcosa]
MKKSKTLDFKVIFGRLFAFMKPYRKGLIVSIIFIVLASMFNSFAPFILGKATDAMIHLVVGGEPSSVGIKNFITILIVLSICYALYSVFKYFSTHIMVRVSQKTIYDIRNRVDDKLKKLPLNYFDTNTYGDILSRITNDVDTISNSLQQSLDQIVTSVTSLIFILIMMLAISPVLTLIGVITVPMALVISMKIAQKAQRFFKEQQDTLGDINGYVEEMYTGHNVISAFSKEEDVIQDFEVTNHELYQSGWKSQFLSSTLMPITQAMTNLGYVGVAVVSGILVISGKMTVGMIQSFIQYLRQFSQPINQTVQISNVLQSTAAAAARIFEFLDEKEEIAEANPSEFPEVVDGTVDFEHVKFGYLPYQTLMHDVSLHVEPGSKVAIVGPTGAGKTTLINLLLRFYDINDGSIRMNGVDVRKMKRAELREIFGMVLQDTWLFTGTIRENIRYGKLNATDEEVINAAKAAHADEFIRMLPGGYDMVLQEGATNIAQGERQLLTIARAILSDAPIMILDEATSSIDTRTEVLIQDAMATLMKGRTSFVIAHRLSTIRDADMIIYMQSGDIKETGTHESLLAANGLYAKLYNSQFAENNG